MTEPKTPDWVKDAVFYQIFPDRFAKSERVPKPSNLEPWDSKPTPHGYKGGDLLGVAEHLDHVENLGATALYFCPVFRAGANHRYHTHDYHVVDPMLGGNEALRELLDAAHARGIRVVLDGVFNHASRGFFEFHDILENGSQSAYLDWFHVERFPLRPYAGKEPPGYKAWWGLPALPKFNTNTPAVREFLWEVGERWVRFGIDGWRLDVANEIDDDEFWREFRRRVKGANPEGYIVGEIWEEAERWLQGDQFDATMNYPFTRLAMGFFGGKTLDTNLIAHSGYKKIETLEAPALAARLERLLALYPWEVTLAQLNLLDSHDTPRFLTSVSGDASAYKLATLFQMTYPGAPCVYYGSEIGLEGRQDPDCRRGMPWDEARWNTDILEFTRAAIALRREVPALRRGRHRALYAKGMVYAYERALEDSLAAVVLNADATAQRAEFHVQPGSYLEHFSKRELETPDGRLSLELPARSGLVLVRR